MDGAVRAWRQSGLSLPTSTTLRQRASSFCTSSRSCWGVPFLVSTVFTAGTPLVGNYARGARLWLRSGAEILAGLNASDFVQRRMSLMATMRVAFKTIRPTAFTEVTSF